MLYRVSLTGNHNRFTVPQLGYLGYHCRTLINLIWHSRERPHGTTFFSSKATYCSEVAAINFLIFGV